MKDYPSYTEETSQQRYRPRWCAQRLREVAAAFPITVLTGPRQTGKSTLLKNEKPFCDWRYVTLDDFDSLAAALSEPHELWAGTNQIVLDEVQRAPRVLSAVKVAVDSNPSMRFALTGSADLLLMRAVSETLAGRAAYHTLGPMTLGEMRQNAAPNLLPQLLEGKLPAEGRVAADDPMEFAARGMMPRFLGLDPEFAPSWWEGYVTTYLERDLRELAQVESLPDFRRLMAILALRQGQLLNKSEAARDAGLSQPTAHRYTSLLETSGLLQLLPAFALNRTKRLIKSPRAFWTDSGLAAFLSGHYSAESLRASREAGAAFEALVIQHVRSLTQTMSPMPRLHYWRTTAGLEVDLVLEHGRSLLAFEIKLAEKVSRSDAANLRTFLDEYPETLSGVAVYAGDEIRVLGERLIAVPWTVIAGAG